MVTKKQTIEIQLEEITSQLEEFQKQRKYNDEVFQLFKVKKDLQRELSLLKGEETAIVLDYQYAWDVGAPMPHVISCAHKTFLIYYLKNQNPAWDGSYVNVVNTNSNQEDLIAVVEFIGCYNYQFGGINDEVIHGHPLYEHGLEGYRVNLIENSKWLYSLQKINSVHSNYTEESWIKRKHYMFMFHDEIFECIADDYQVVVYKSKFRDVIEITTNKLFT